MPLLVDSATWIALGLAIGTAVVALLVAALVAIALLRRRPDRKPPETSVVAANPRSDEIMSDLSEALELAHEENRRSRELSGIRESLDLDAVLAKTLAVADSVAGVDAAMIVLPPGSANGGPQPLIATVGMTVEEAEHQPIEGPPEGHEASAVRISYSYAEDRQNDRDLIRGGIAVPVKNETDELVGTLAVFWRSEQEPADDAMKRVEELASSAGPATENAYRFQEARQLADIDALTGIHNRRYFHETLGREVSRARRYERRLALLIFDIDDFKTINDRAGHLSGDALLAEVGDRVKSAVRGADVACRVGGDEFGVILPESSRGDAEQLYRRIQFAVASKPAGSSEPIRLSAGIAELRADDDAEAFFERADEALYQAKEEGKGRAVDADRR